MSLIDHQGEAEYPFHKDIVFDAFLKTIPSTGLSVGTSDKLTGRIVAKAGVSLFSWGENIPIAMTEVTPTRTRVSITSTPKTGVLFGGAFDLGKNRHNIETLFSAVSNRLSQHPGVLSNPVPPALSPAPEPHLITQYGGEPIYVLRDGNVEGPMSADLVWQMVHSEELLPDNPVRIEGSRQWISFEELPDEVFSPSLERESAQALGIAIAQKPESPPTSALFYLHRSGQQDGPFASDQIRNMWTNGLITADTLYWHEGLDDWLPVRDFCQSGTPS